MTTATIGVSVRVMKSVVGRQKAGRRSGSVRAPGLVALALVTVLAAVVSVGAGVVAAPVAGAATAFVTNCADSGPGSLRSAVANAGSGDTITFAVTCPPASPILLTSGPIEIATNLTIEGPGPNEVAVSGNFIVDGGVSDAVISGLTIENGDKTDGGGIDNNGTLTVSRSIISGDAGGPGSCSTDCFSEGGGIYNEGNLTLTDSTVSGNTLTDVGCTAQCFSFGAGVFNDGTMVVTDSTFSENVARSGDSNCGFDCNALGGAIFNNDLLTVTGSTFSDNSATVGASCPDECDTEGGAILNNGDATITNSTIADNSVNADPCGSNCGALGGGIENVDTLTVRNSTLWANTVSATGCTADCFVGGGDIEADSRVTLGATIVAGSASTGGDCDFASLTDLGYNLDDDGSCGFSPADNDYSDTPSGLDSAGLQNNGGPTETIALEPGSLAIDHVAATLCPATDQRGFPRHPPCDIGAYDTDGGPGLVGSAIDAVVQVETDPAFAGDPVEISSPQLEASCAGVITLESLQGGGVGNPQTSTGSISVILDDDGNATVVVEGSDCPPGTDLVEADLIKAPYLTAVTTLVVSPPAVTPEGVSGTPADEVETGDTPASGESDVYEVFEVETSPVYAEQPVEISSPELENRCGLGWRWEPGNGGPEIDGPSPVAAGIAASTTLDDDGNATFVFEGASCAAGPSTVIADIDAGTHTTYATTFTVAPPAVTLPVTASAKGTAPATKHRHRHHRKGKGGTTTPTAPAMTVSVSPNPVMVTGS